jgi:hypothetical protein
MMRLIRIDPSNKIKETAMDLMTVKIENPQALNLILGHSHFIKTVEDLYEALSTAYPLQNSGLLCGHGRLPGPLYRHRSRSIARSQEWAAASHFSYDMLSIQMPENVGRAGYCATLLMTLHKPNRPRIWA